MKYYNCCCLLCMMAFLIFQARMVAQPPGWAWAKAIKGEINRESIDTIVSLDIVIDSSSNDVYTTGYFYGSVDFDPGEDEFTLTSIGSLDMFILKLDSEGGFVWVKRVGGEGGGCISYSLSLDTLGNIFATGDFSYMVDFDPGPGINNILTVGENDIFILKLTGDGEFVWVKTIGGDGATDRPASIFIERGTGNIYVTGTMNCETDFDPGPGYYFLGGQGYCYLDIFILKLNSQGEFLWAREIQGVVYYDNTGTSIVSDPSSGSVYTAGVFYATCDFDTGAGSNYLTSNGEADIFILKLDEDGNYIWAIQIGGEEMDEYPSIALGQSESNNIYACGSFRGMVDFDPGTGTYYLPAVNSDVFLLKLDDNGNFNWAESMGGPENDFVRAIALDSSQDFIYLTGGFEGIVDFDPGSGVFNLTSNGILDVFISKLDSEGNYIWALSAGGTGTDYATSIACSLSGLIHVTGSYDSPVISFDSIDLENIDDPDMFVAKLGGCQGIVTNTNDSGAGSLRDIVACSSSGGIITFDLPPMSQINLTSGEIIINKNLTISGPGPMDLTISGNNQSRIFNLFPGNFFSVSGLSLKNATEVSNGGAVYSGGNLTLKNVILENNFENIIHRALTLPSSGSLLIQQSVSLKQ